MSVPDSSIHLPESAELTYDIRAQDVGSFVEETLVKGNVKHPAYSPMRAVSIKDLRMLGGGAYMICRLTVVYETQVRM